MQGQSANLGASATTAPDPPRDSALCCAATSNRLEAWSAHWNAQRIVSHIAIIVVGAGLYGASMGWWRDPMQALYTAIKFPLDRSAHRHGNAMLNAMLAPLLGLNIPFRQSFLADPDELHHRGRNPRLFRAAGRVCDLERAADVS